MMSSPKKDASPSTAQPRRTVVRKARTGASYAMPPGPQIAMIGAADTDNEYELIEIDASPGRGPPLHIHRTFDESFYVLQGELTVWVDGRKYVLAPGDIILIPAGAVHTWKNASEADARFLQFTVPGHMELMTAELAAAGPISPEEMAKIADKHDTTIVGPPM